MKDTNDKCLKKIIEIRGECFLKKEECFLKKEPQKKKALFRKKKIISNKTMKKWHKNDFNYLNVLVTMQKQSQYIPPEPDTQAIQ